MKRLDIHGNPIRNVWDFILPVAIIVLLLGILVFAAKREISASQTYIPADTLMQRYEDLVYENEILWTYVENVDSFKTLEDAVSARDRIYEQIQFIDE